MISGDVRRRRAVWPAWASPSSAQPRPANANWPWSSGAYLLVREKKNLCQPMTVERPLRGSLRRPDARPTGRCTPPIPGQLNRRHAGTPCSPSSMRRPARSRPTGRTRSAEWQAERIGHGLARLRRRAQRGRAANRPELPRSRHRRRRPIPHLAEVAWLHRYEAEAPVRGQRRPRRCNPAG